MSADPEVDWGCRALNYASAIAGAPRGSATAAETRAAETVRRQLAGLGVADVREQPFRGLRSIWLFLSLAFGWALIGHAAYWLLRRPLGAIPALLVSTAAFALAFYLFWQKFTYRHYPLRGSLPHGPSQNIIAAIPASQVARKTVVFHAHLDSHRAVIWFASDFLLRVYGALAPLALMGALISPILYILAALSWPPLAWVGLVFAAAQFIAWFSGVSADLGPYSPGANDNAAAAGLLLGLAERLQTDPLVHTDVRLVFTGCEETGCDGMIAFLRENGALLNNALFVNFELIGIGERLVYLQSEGVIRKRRIAGETERLVQTAGEAIGLQPAPGLGSAAFTETGVVWEAGLDGVCFVTLRNGSHFLPEWHRLTDTVERLQPAALQRAHQMAWRLLQVIDRAG